VRRCTPRQGSNDLTDILTTDLRRLRGRTDVESMRGSVRNRPEEARFQGGRVHRVTAPDPECGAFRRLHEQKVALKFQSATSLVLGRGASWRRTLPLTVAPDLSAMPLERLVLHDIGAMPDLSSLDQLTELDLSLNPLTALPPLGEPPLVSFIATDTPLRRFPMALTRLDTPGGDRSGAHEDR
jgi:hypothetical protein